jgi:tetratricopeptide (TPR) repeat protein
MAPEPAGRFASMDELLERLGARSSRRGWWLGLAVAGIAGGGLAFVLSDDGPAAGCDTDARLFAVWNQGRRDELAARFESSAVSYAGTTWRRTAPLLEAYAASWRDAYQNTCARLRADPAAAALDGHMQCLSSRLHALESLVDVLDAGDRSVIEHAVSATSRLPAISACLLGDPAYTDPTPADATLAGQVAAVRRRVVRATVLRDAGQFDAALAEATRAHTDAEVLAWRPLLAETGACLGTSYERTGEYARAVEQLERSWLDAVATGHDGAAVHASTELVFVLGFQMQRLDEAQQWARHAESALGPLGHRPVAQARLDNSMGAVLSGLGDHEAAAARFAQAEALFAEGLGPGHPDIATALHNLAAAQVALGRYAEAEASVRRALPVFAESLGPEHPDTANAMDLLGNALQRQGRLDEAAEVADKALEMRIAILSSDHPDVARSYNNLGSLYEARGDDVRALSHYRKALAVFERVMGESSMYAAAARINVAAVLVRTGDIDTAIRALDESGATFERELPAEHAYRVHRLVVLGQAELARGRAPEALAAAEEVRMSCDAMALEPGLCGMGRFVRAAARWELGKKEGAVAEARRALGELQRGATAETADIMRVQTWLAVRDAGEPR